MIRVLIHKFRRCHSERSEEPAFLCAICVICGLICSGAQPMTALLRSRGVPASGRRLCTGQGCDSMSAMSASFSAASRHKSCILGAVLILRTAAIPSLPLSLSSVSQGAATFPSEIRNGSFGLPQALITEKQDRGNLFAFLICLFSRVLAFSFQQPGNGILAQNLPLFSSNPFTAIHDRSPPLPLIF